MKSSLDAHSTLGHHPFTHIIIYHEFKIVKIDFVYHCKMLTQFWKPTFVNFPNLEI